MNYYQHHIGDFRSGTIHFTRLMRWVYRDMIEVYYDREAPLPLALDDLHDLLGTYSDEECNAVQRVLRIKFEKRETGYHHKVCDDTIEIYKAAAEEQKARQENEAERQRRYRERRTEVFRVLREEFDQVPDYDTPMKELNALLNQLRKSREAGQTSSGSTEDKHSTSQPVTRDIHEHSIQATAITINQEPETNNQEPNGKDSSSGLRPDDVSPPSGDPDENAGEEPPEKAGGKRLVSTEEDRECAAWIFERVQRVNPGAKQPSNWNAWGNTIRLMREIDERTHRQICELFNWVITDSFWCKNVMCPETLRKQWDKLVVARNMKPASTLLNKPTIYDQGMANAAKAKELLFGKKPDGEVIDA